MWTPEHLNKEWHYLDSYGPSSFRFVHKCGLRVIISTAAFKIGEILDINNMVPEKEQTEANGYVEWIHISLSRKDRIPDWKDLVKVRSDFLSLESYAYIVFPPEDKYVNIHKYCLSIYSRLDGKPCLPDFHMVLPGGINSI